MSIGASIQPDNRKIEPVVRANNLGIAFRRVRRASPVAPTANASRNSRRVIIVFLSTSSQESTLHRVVQCPSHENCILLLRLRNHASGVLRISVIAEPITINFLLSNVTYLISKMLEYIVHVGSMSGVENRRSSGSLPVAFVGAAFAGHASVRFGMALFPVPAHRTGQAHLAHPALGERFTISPTESCLSE